MLEYYFDDVGALRYVIRILNETIKTYGQVDVDFVKRFLDSRYEPKFKDSCVGWTEVFVESRDVKPILRGNHWNFKFTLPEPKELK